MNYFFRTLLLFVFISSIIGCATNPTRETEANPYPIQIITTYPQPGEDINKEIVPNIEVIPFKFYKPVYSGDSTVTGSGVPGVPIIIYNVTFMGEVLGESFIQPDGTFSIKVQPLEKDNRIGLSLGTLEGTQWTQADFQYSGFNGDEARLVPMVGFFYDTTMVISK